MKDIGQTGTPQKEHSLDLFVGYLSFILWGTPVWTFEPMVLLADVLHRFLTSTRAIYHQRTGMALIKKSKVSLNSFVGELLNLELHTAIYKYLDQ